MVVFLGGKVVPVPRLSLFWDALNVPRIHRDRSQEHRRWEADKGEVAWLGVSGGLCFWPPLGGQAFLRMWVQEDALVLTQGSGRSLDGHWGSGSGPGLKPRDVLAGLPPAARRWVPTVFLSPARPRLQ